MSKPQPKVKASTKSVKSTISQSVKQMNTSNANHQQHIILTSHLNQQPRVNNGQNWLAQLNKYKMNPAELREYLDLIAMKGVIPPRTTAQMAPADEAELLELYTAPRLPALPRLPRLSESRQHQQRDEFYMGLSLDTLFYKFYNSKEFQMMAIRTLTGRNWMFHKTHRQWFKRFVLVIEICTT